MNRIGIIGAMDQEIALLKNTMEIEAVEEKAGMKFFLGTLEGRPTALVRSGIGKVNAAVCAEILAEVYHIDRLINTGIAGSLSPAIDICDIVVSTDAMQHDVDVTGFGHLPGEIPQMECSTFTADPALIRLAERVCREVLPEIGVHAGRIVSGDQFIQDHAKKKWLAETFGAVCCEMEGAAIAQAAYLNRIPFVILRAISDKADDSAAMAYDQFEKEAIANSVKLMHGMLREIS